MRSRRAVALALLMLLPLVPTPPAAEAGHVDHDRSLIRLFEESGNWTISERGTYEVDGSNPQASGTYTASIQTEWSAEGPVTYEPDTGLIRGEGWPLTSRVVGTIVEHAAGGVTNECTIDETRTGTFELRGLWSLGRERQAQLLGIEGSLAVRAGLEPHAARHITHMEWTCVETFPDCPPGGGRPLGEGGTCIFAETYGREVSVSVHGLYAADRYLAGAIPEGDVRGLGYWDGTGTWPAPRGSDASVRHMGDVMTNPYVAVPSWGPNLVGNNTVEFERTVERAWPDSFSSDIEGLAIARGICGTATYSEYSGTCTATSLILLQTGTDWCEAAARMEQEDVVILREMIATYPTNPTEAQILRFVNSLIAPQVTSILGIERQRQLLGCPDARSLNDLARELRPLEDRILADLERLHREGKLTQDGRDLAAGIWRQRALLGTEGATAGGDGGHGGATAAAAAGGSGPGGVSASTASPVSIHAYDLLGRHVGWNDTRGEPDVEIPNASYEGRPGEAQRIELPPGLWRFEVEELADGNYTFVVEWNLTGVEGRDVFPFTTTPGHVFRARYFAGYEESGNASMIPGSVYRGEPAADALPPPSPPAWLEAALAGEPADDDDQEGPDTSSNGGNGNTTVDGTGNGTDPGSPSPAGVPGLGGAALLGAFAVASLAFRRSRRRG